MPEVIIDTILEYPELIQSNQLRLSGKLMFEGVVKIEIKEGEQTFVVYRTIAQTMAFLDACDTIESLIISAKFGSFFVL